MEEGQTFDLRCMMCRDRHAHVARRFEVCRSVLPREPHSIATRGVLDGDFPDRGRARIHFVGGIRDELPCTAWQA